MKRTDCVTIGPSSALNMKIATKKLHDNLNWAYCMIANSANIHKFGCGSLLNCYFEYARVIKRNNKKKNVLCEQRWKLLKDANNKMRSREKLFQFSEFHRFSRYEFHFIHVTYYRQYAQQYFPQFSSTIEKWICCFLIHCTLHSVLNWHYNCHIKRNKINRMTCARILFLFHQIMVIRKSPFDAIETKRKAILSY